MAKEFLKGKGCPECGKLSSVQSRTMTTDEFIRRAKLVHGDKYDYSETIYKNANTKVIIIIKETGEKFEQTPSNHLSGKTSVLERNRMFSEQYRKPIEKFIKEGNEIHNYKFDYSETLTEISDFLKQHNLEVVENDRKLIKPYELDIYLPEYKLAIEYCGLYWHSELAGKTKQYHINKQIMCEAKGIRLVTIFEDEWNDKKEIVKSTLLHFVKKSIRGVYARNLDIRQIDWSVAKNMLE